MRSDVDRRFLGCYCAVARCAMEENRDSAPSCMRSATQIPLYYLDGPGGGGVLIAKQLDATGDLDPKAMEN